MPDSNWRFGSATFPAFDKLRNVANATRAHSTVARQPLDADGAAGDLCVLMPPAGDVDTRFSDRGCRGVIGMEFDRRSAFRLADLASWPGVRGGADAAGEFLAASPNDLSVALMTSVANTACSFAVSPPLGPSFCCAVCAVARGARFAPAAGVPLAAVVGFVVRDLVVGFVSVLSMSLPWSSSLSVADMVGVQV
jgi:hypothetical protein